MIGCPPENKYSAQKFEAAMTYCYISCMVHNCNTVCTPNKRSVTQYGLQTLDSRILEKEFICQLPNMLSTQNFKQQKYHKIPKEMLLTNYDKNFYAYLPNTQ